MIDVGAALAFRKRFGKSFEHFWLFQPNFLEGQVQQVYGEIWNGGWQLGSILIKVDTQLASLQRVRAADHWLVNQVPKPSSLVLIGMAAFQDS